MNRSVWFYVFGEAKPQGSKKGFVVNGRAVLVESAGPGHKAWRLAVTSRARQVMERPDFAGAFGPDEPLRVSLSFALRRPKSGATGLVWHAKRPDIDKLARSTLDGLTDAGLIHDDSRIAELSVRKVYADDEHAPGVLVHVAPLTPVGLVR